MIPHVILHFGLEFVVIRFRMFSFIEAPSCNHYLQTSSQTIRDQFQPFVLILPKIY